MRQNLAFFHLCFSPPTLQEEKKISLQVIFSILTFHLQYLLWWVRWMNGMIGVNILRARKENKVFFFSFERKGENVWYLIGVYCKKKKRTLLYEPHSYHIKYLKSNAIILRYLRIWFKSKNFYNATILKRFLQKGPYTFRQPQRALVLYNFYKRPSVWLGNYFFE